MSGMKRILELLTEYEESLHAYGHADGLVVMLKRELLNYGMSDVRTMVEGIDREFDMLVFNNQTEGRF